MRIFFFFFLLIIYKANANPDSLEVVRIFQQVSMDFAAGNLKELDPKIQKGYALLEKQDDLFNWIRWHRRIGKKWRKAMQYDQAISSFEQAIRPAWRKAKNDREWRQLAFANGDLGVFHMKNLNNYGVARDYYEKFKTLFKDSLSADELSVAKYVYNQLGNINTGLRDEAKASFYFEQVQQISKKHQKWPLYSKACRNHAGLYKTLDKYPQAIEVIQAGLSFQDSMSAEQNLLLWIDLGLCFYHIEDYQKARQFTDRAKAIFKQHLKQFSKTEIAGYQYNFYFNNGRIDKGEGKYKAAAANYQKALKLLETDLQEGNRRQMAIMQSNLGHLYFVQKQFEKAEKHFQSAIPFLSFSLNAYQDPFTISPEDLTSEYLLGYCYHFLGKITLAKYQATSNTDLLPYAIRFYEIADLVNQIQLQIYATEQSNLTALEAQRALKEDLQFALYELSLVDSSDSLAQKMFAVSEKSRSLLLLEQKRLTEDLSNWEEEAQKNYLIKKAQRQSLKKEIYALKTNTFSKQQEQLFLLQEQLFKIEDDLLVLKNQKNKAAKFIFGKAASIAQIQKNLAFDQALIEFFVGENHIYTYVISQKEFKVYRKLRSPEFTTTVEKLRNSLIQYGEEVDRFGHPAYALYEYLLKSPLAQLPSTINRLLLAKDHYLNFIPFEALITQPFAKEWYYHDLPYLLHQYSISNVNSATLWEKQKQIPPGRASALFAGYAPSYQVKNIATKDTLHMQQLATLVRSGQFELKSAQAEVRNITQYLKGDSFSGELASEFHFKQKASDYQILLLSMHGMVNEMEPHFSQLLFTPNANLDSEEDNLLQPIELYDLSLNADLVVLSACETGLGKIYPGEGVFSFSRAFSSAGVPSTVMSLWKVNDQSTAEIIMPFFQNLRAGFSKDIALQNAKRSYLLAHPNNRMAVHPYFWSGLQLCGNSDALEWPSRFSLLSGVLLFSLLIVLSFSCYFWFLKK